MTHEFNPKRTVNKMWMTVIILLSLVVIFVVLLALVAQETSPEYEAPPTDDRRVIDAGSLEECPVVASKVGGDVEVLRRPGRGEMVVGTVPDGTELDVVNLRVDFVEIRGPLVGYVERRDTRRACQ